MTPLRSPMSPRPSRWPFVAAAAIGVLAYLATRLVLAPAPPAGQGLGGWLWAACFGQTEDGGRALRLAVAGGFGASLLPLALGAFLHWRQRRAWLQARQQHRLPEVAGRARREWDALPWRIAGSYGLHVMLIVFSVVSLRGCVLNLGMPPGGGEPHPGASEQTSQETVRVTRFRRHLVVNPNMAILLTMPRDMPIDLPGATRQDYGRSNRLGLDGKDPGSGAGGKGDALHLAIVNHGGRGWDDAVADGGPRFLAELGRRTGVKVATRPDAVTIGQLAAQADPMKQPPLLYFGVNGQPGLSGEDHAWLRRYCLEIGGTILIDDTSGQGMVFARELAARLFPGHPFIAIPADDRLFHDSEDLGGLAQRERALAAHGGDRIMGVRSGERWVLICHPGDLVDGWRGAYKPAWQEIAVKFGVNVFRNAAAGFRDVRRRAETRPP